MAYRQNIGHSVYLNGTSQYLMRSGISFGPTDKFFLRIVAKTYHLGFKTYARLFYIGNDHSTSGISCLHYNASSGPDSTHHVYNYFNTSANSFIHTGPAFLNTGLNLPNMGRFVMVYVWDGTYWCVYWNGGRVKKYDCGGTITATSKALYIGAEPGPNCFWPGLIDDVIIDTTKIPSIFTTYPDEYDELFLTAPDFCNRLGFTPEHMWTFENAANLGEDTGNPGGWNLTAYNNPTQGDPLCGELVDEPPLVVSVTTDKAAGYSPLEVRIEAYASGGTGNYEYSFGVSDDGGLTWAWTSWQSENFYQTTLSTYTDKEYLWKVKVRDGNSEIESEIERIMVYVRPPSTILISSDTSDGIAPKTINFTSEIPYGFPPYEYSWQWRLEGGDWTVFGSQQNAQLLFQQAGNYEVCCQVRDSADRYYYSNTLKIELNQPRVEITADKYTGDFPLEVSFTSSLIGSAEASYSFRWEYSKDNGLWQLFSQLRNPTYTFTIPGIYKIRCTITDQYGNSDVSNEIIISEVLDVEIESDLISGIPPLTVHFTSRVKGGSAPYSYRWEYSKGGGSWTQFSTVPNPEYIFELEDRYDIRCTVTDNLGKQDVSNILKIVAMRGIPFVAHEGVQIRVRRKRT